MKAKSIFLLMIVVSFSVNAQKGNCNCSNTKGVNSVTSEGKVIYKGKNTQGNFIYDLSIVFTNQTNCKVLIPDVQFNANEKILQPNLTLPANQKNKKVKYQVRFTTTMQLNTQPGLDDNLFAELVVGYNIGKNACTHIETVAYIVDSNQQH